MKKSEQRQNDILAFMKKTIAAKGYSPTVREICAALEIKSTSTVHSDIKALEDKGLVRKDPAKPRTVLPVENEYIRTSEVSYDTVALPVIGRVAAGSVSFLFFFVCHCQETRIEPFLQIHVLCHRIKPPFLSGDRIVANTLSEITDLLFNTQTDRFSENITSI